MSALFFGVGVFLFFLGLFWNWRADTLETSPDPADQLRAKHSHVVAILVMLTSSLALFQSIYGQL